MTQSPRHLYVGTTNSKILIFSKYNICERDDLHHCNIPNVNKTYCLQVTLKLPAKLMMSGNLAEVTDILCCGPNYDYSMLWSGDTLGKLSLWSVPTVGINYKPLKSWFAHTAAVRQLGNTWRNLISIGDDGLLLIHDLISLQRMRRMDLTEWAVYRNLILRPDITRKLKSLAIHEDFENGGTMIVGTSYGEIVVMNIGTQV